MDYLNALGSAITPTYNRSETQVATFQSGATAGIVCRDCITISEQEKALKTFMTALRYWLLYRGRRHALLAILLKRRGR